MSEKTFDLSAMVKTVSNLDTSAAAPQVRMIPLDDIVENQANFYSVDKAELSDLVNSIAMDGLQQYPVVMPHPNQPGKYQLISGHRRCAAIRLLVEDAEHPREDLRLVPCTVRQYQSGALAELQLILANSTTRKLSAPEISRQAERMTDLLYQLKEEGYEFPGRMRDLVAAACNVSAPKLARLKVIRDKLAADFMYLFEKNKLPEQTAYALARLPEDFQNRLAGITHEMSGAAAERILGKYEEGWRWAPEMTCRDGKPCKRGDAFLRHDLEDPYSMCGGMTCCMECGNAKSAYSPCSRMCSRAQALRKEARDEKKAAKDRAKQERVTGYQRETQANAQRVLRAVEAAELPDDAQICWGFDSLSVGSIREYAAGKFPEGKYWYHAELSADGLRDPARVAEVLGCTTDYLLGATDELVPAAAKGQDFETGPLESALLALAWIPGNPDSSGQVVARFAVDDDSPLAMLCFYNAQTRKYSFSEDGAAIEAECLGWWPVPEADQCF